MKIYDELAQSVKFYQRGPKTVLLEKHKDLEFIGAGRSAFVFKIKSTNKALKVFFPQFKHIAKEEARIYKSLKGIDYFPTLYWAGENYLVMDYLEGDTFFDCLNKGLEISQEHIDEVDAALNLARERGTNPSDIHLRNILLTPTGKIKLIDVARFGQKKECSQWSDLKKAFYKFYKKRIIPKKMPVWLMNFIAALYKKKWISAF